jgi:hypothetical protein
MDFAVETRLAGQGDDTQILDDQGVRVDMALQVVNQLAGPVQFVGLEQGVDRNVDLDPPIVGQPHQLSQLRDGEILGFHARRHGFETAIDGVGAGRQGRQKRGAVSRRSENGRLVVKIHGRALFGFH